MSRKPKAKPGKAGRPAHAASDQSRRQVEMMAAFGLTEEQIGLVVGISEPTLRLHYQHELAAGHLKATVAVANNLFRQATKDDPRSFQAIQFWLRCRAGWSEYSPAPTDRRIEPPGKKELQQAAAETAAEGTGWGNLVH